jgi:hypothetical protein
VKGKLTKHLQVGGMQKPYVGDITLKAPELTACTSLSRVPLNPVDPGLYWYWLLTLYAAKGERKSRGSGTNHHPVRRLRNALVGH